MPDNISVVRAVVELLRALLGSDNKVEVRHTEQGIRIFIPMVGVAREVEFSGEEPGQEAAVYIDQKPVALSAEELDNEKARVLSLARQGCCEIDLVPWIPSYQVIAISRYVEERGFRIHIWKKSPLLEGRSRFRFTPEGAARFFLRQASSISQTEGENLVLVNREHPLKPEPVQALEKEVTAASGQAYAPELIPESLQVELIQVAEAVLPTLEAEQSPENLSAPFKASEAAKAESPAVADKPKGPSLTKEQRRQARAEAARKRNRDSGSDDHLIAGLRRSKDHRFKGSQGRGIR